MSEFGLMARSRRWANAAAGLALGRRARPSRRNAELIQLEPDERVSVIARSIVGQHGHWP